MSSVVSALDPQLSAIDNSSKLQEQVAQLGFDWKSIDDIWNKLQEEIQELKVETTTGPNALINNHQRLLEELGDVLFVCINLARHLQVNPEVALATANQRFLNRFRHMEQQLDQQNCTVKESSFEALLALWDEAKKAEA